MTKILPYCAFLDRAGTSRPDSGVKGADLREIKHGALGLLWSQVEWPFDPPELQTSAVEFHRVVAHMFSQGAVIPFRLLSVFDSEQELQDFVASHQADLVADLQRLQNMVQMECVLYFAPQPGVRPSGKDYLERKAELLRHSEEFVQSISHALKGICKEIRTRESKTGCRIFVLVGRGDENTFHSQVQDLPIPQRMARRLSGPWPAAEFLSDSVKTPQIAGQR